MVSTTGKGNQRARGSAWNRSRQVRKRGQGEPGLNAESELWKRNSRDELQWQLSTRCAIAERHSEHCLQADCRCSGNVLCGLPIFHTQSLLCFLSGTLHSPGGSRAWLRWQGPRCWHGRPKVTTRFLQFWLFHMRLASKWKIALSLAASPSLLNKFGGKNVQMAKCKFLCHIFDHNKKKFWKKATKLYYLSTLSDGVYTHFQVTCILPYSCNYF